MPKTKTNNFAQLRDRYHDYRRLMEVRAEETEGTEDLILTGTPVIFDKPYLLFKHNNKEVYEVIEHGAFDVHDQGKPFPIGRMTERSVGLIARFFLPGEIRRNGVSVVG